MTNLMMEIKGRLLDGNIIPEKVSLPFEKITTDKLMGGLFALDYPNACPKCGETFAVKPPGGTCPICDAAVLPEPQIHEADPHGEKEGLPSPKRRL